MDKLKSILYVEDEIIVRNELSDFLQYYCEDLSVASNGQEALDIYTTKDFDLLITDVRMSKMDGLSLAKKVKEINSEQAVIFLTAFNDTNYLYDALSLNASAYILKPLDFDILEKKIEEIIISKHWKISQENYKKELENILSTTNDGIAIIDFETNFLYVNRAFEKIIGYSKTELYNLKSTSITNEENIPNSFEKIDEVIKNGFVNDYKKTYITKYNKEIEVSINATLMSDKQRIIYAIRDITEQKEKDQILENYISIVDENVITSTTTLDGTITKVSSAFCRISGYSKDELIGEKHNIIRDPDMPESLFKKMWETINSNKSWRGEIKNRKKDGSFYWVDAVITPIINEKGIKTGYTSIRNDITDKKNIEQLSIIDPLTQLYNRRHFSKMLSNVINSAKRENKIFSFLILDVDFFKLYNDTYGHQKGDNVLIEIAKSLKDSLRRADDYSFRLGGEEFAVTYKSDNVEGSKEFAQIIRKSIEDLKIIHTKNEASKYITVSIGLLILKSTNEMDLNEIYRLSDNLLYKAKKDGRNKIEVSVI